AVYDDEIDLFELAQDLWREKVLVVLVTFMVTVVAGVYVTAVPSVYSYSASMTLKPASLHEYGRLAAAMQTEGKQGLQVATEVTTTAFSILQNNLDSQLSKQKFAAVNGKDVLFSTSVPKGRNGVLLLEASSNNAKELRKR